MLRVATTMGMKAAFGVRLGVVAAVAILRKLVKMATLLLMLGMHAVLLR